MQAAGNDYIYVYGQDFCAEDASRVAGEWCDRHKGIGADGIVLINPSHKADFRMQMFNADGSEGKMCGNGSRCVGKYVYDHGICRKDEITMESPAGVRTLKIHAKNGVCETVTVDMGTAKLTGPVPEKITVNGEEKEMIAVDVGNPHAVYYVPSKEILMSLELTKIGPGYEHHPRFPEGVNSEFIFVEDRKNLWMRVWERGSGETLACGTGATASAYATMVSGLCDKDVTIHLLGGDLEITLGEDGHLFMTGEATEVFHGEIDLK